MNNYSVIALWARNLKKMKIKRNAHFLIAFRINANNIFRFVRQDVRKRSFLTSSLSYVRITVLIEIRLSGRKVILTKMTFSI